MDEQSLSHTKWKCQYHIVIVPKYRRKAIYGKLRQDIGVILRKLCEYKHVEIIEAHAMPDHIHMLLSIPPKLSVGDFMGYLKGKSRSVRYLNWKVTDTIGYINGVFPEIVQKLLPSIICINFLFLNLY